MAVAPLNKSYTEVSLITSNFLRMNFLNYDNYRFKVEEELIAGGTGIAAL